MKQRFEVVIYHEQPYLKEVIKKFYIWVEMSKNGREGRDEFVYARVRLSEEV